MALYTFFMCNADGSANSLEVFDLVSDGSAAGRAARMLEQHQSCAYVSVFQDDRPVLARHRPRPPAGASRDRAYRPA